MANKLMTYQRILTYWKQRRAARQRLFDYLTGLNQRERDLNTINNAMVLYYQGGQLI